MNVPKEILAIIPARGGSKGIPGKNIKPLAGKPLLAYAIEAGKQSRYITRLVVSTEDEAIAAVATRYAAEVVKRPPELAQDETTMPPVLLQAVTSLELEGYTPDIVVLLQPTSPLRATRHIDGAIEKFFSGPYDSLLGVTLIYEHRFESDEQDCVVPVEKERKNRQERRPVIIENGSVYITTPKLIKEGKILGDHIGYFPIEKDAAVDIDDPFDFFLAEQSILAYNK